MEKTDAMRIIRRLESDLADLKQFVAGEESAPSENRVKNEWLTFTEVGPPESDVTYKWPPDNVDRYRTYQRYEDARGVRLGLGWAEPGEFYGRMREYTVVHEISKGGGLDALAVFVSADDYETSGELLGLIKGKGQGGRKMFRPGDNLPPAYERAEKDGLVADFIDRVTGPYSRDGLAIVCHKDKPNRMLQHAVVQREFRRR